MTYDTVAAVSQVTSLLLFVTLFMIVIGYVLWPKNGEKFNKAARVALDLDKNKTARGDR